MQLGHLVAVLEEGSLEAEAGMHGPHVPEVGLGRAGRDRRVPVLGEDAREAPVLVVGEVIGEHADRQRVKRVHGRELGVRRGAEVRLIVEAREVKTLPGEGGQARGDRLAVDLQIHRERLQGLGVDDDDILPARAAEERRGALRAARVIGQEPHRPAGARAPRWSASRRPGAAPDRPCGRAGCRSPRRARCAGSSIPAGPARSARPSARCGTARTSPAPSTREPDPRFAPGARRGGMRRQARRYQGRRSRPATMSR